MSYFIEFHTNVWRYGQWNKTRTAYCDFFAQSASYSAATVSSFPGIKRSEREAYHLPPRGAGIMNEWNYASNPSVPL